MFRHCPAKNRVAAVAAQDVRSSPMLFVIAGLVGQTGLSCPTCSDYVGSATRIGTASGLRGPVGCVDTAAISYRQTLATTIAGTSAQTTTVNIYGPFEAGFSSAQPGMSCLGSQTLAAGIDTYTAELMIRYMCSDNSISLLDTCGDHANPRHFHEMLTNCLSGQAISGHSTRLGTSGDNRGIYGFFEADGVYPTLDVCGAHVGITPDSNGQPVVHYHSQVYPPFFVGCYTNADATMTFAQCRALFTSCSSASTISQLPTALAPTREIALAGTRIPDRMSSAPPAPCQLTGPALSEIRPWHLPPPARRLHPHLQPVWRHVSPRQRW